MEPIMLRLAGMEEESIVDGPGLRFVIFTQGCPHACKGCQNPETHPYTEGTLTPLTDILHLYDENPLLCGMTFSGGEPFLHAQNLCVLAKEIHARKGSIVTYTGYTYEQLKDFIKTNTKTDWQNLLDETDILIDGPYIEEQRNIDLLFRGSENQRILDRDSRTKLDALTK